MSQRLAENLSKESIYYTQELLGKMIRQGHEGNFVFNKVFDLRMTDYFRYCDEVYLSFC